MSTLLDSTTATGLSGASSQLMTSQWKPGIMVMNHSECYSTYLILNYNLEFQCPASYGRHPHTQKVKVKGQLVQKIESKKTDGQTDTSDCITFPTNVVGNEYT